MRTILRVPLGELVEVKYGKSLRETERDPNGSFPVYGSNGIVGKSAAPLVSHPTIVIGRKGAVGEAHLAENGCWPIDTAFYTVLRQEGRVNLRYLHRWLRAIDLKRLAITSTIPGINRDTLAALPVPVPPLAEQERIAGILDEADALRQLRAQADRRTTALLPALFHQMFGDPTTNPKRWPKAKLGELCELVNGAPFKPSDWDGEGLPIVRIQNLNDPTKPFNYTSKKLAERFRVCTGDILLSWSGTPGTSFGCFRWNGPAGWLNQHIFNVKLKKGFDGEFFIQSVNARLSELIARAHGGVGLQHVTKGTLNDVEMLIPPLTLQREFAKRVTEVRELETAQTQSRARLAALFASILDKAFKGEL